MYVYNKSDKQKTWACLDANRSSILKVFGYLKVIENNKRFICLLFFRRYCSYFCDSFVLSQKKYQIKLYFYDRSLFWFSQFWISCDAVERRHFYLSSISSPQFSLSIFFLSLLFYSQWLSLSQKIYAIAFGGFVNSVSKSIITGNKCLLKKMASFVESWVVSQ